MWWAIDYHPDRPHDAVALTPLSQMPGLDGWLYGYSVFTTLRWPLSEHWLRAHLYRLAKDAIALGLTPLPVEPTLNALTRWGENLTESALWRLTGVAHPVTLADFYQAGPPLLPTRWLLRSEPLTPPDPMNDPPQQGLTLKVQPYRDEWPTHKVGSLSKALHQRRQYCHSAGEEEVLWQDPQTGHLTEATTANVFWLSELGHLWTPPARDCLPGITRLQVIAAAPALGMTVREQGLSFVDLATEGITGGFVTNSVRGLQPIARIIGQPDLTPPLSPWVLNWSESTVQRWKTLRQQWLTRQGEGRQDS